MPSLLEIGLANAAFAAGLALLAMLVGRFCRRPAVMHALWLLVLLKLITPPIFSLPLRVLPALKPAVAATTETSTSAAEAPTPAIEDKPIEGKFLILPSTKEGDMMIALKITNSEELSAPAETSVPTEPPPVPASLPPPAPAVSRPDATDSIDWQVIARTALGLWIAGAASWFGLCIVRMVRFQRMLRLAGPAPEELEIRAARLAYRMGVARCPEIALIPGLVPPLLWMVLRRPTIYLPVDLLEKLDETELDTLLAHELAHLRRRDHWVRWLEFAVQGVYWWNPLVLLARRQIQAHEEECCDALVVDLLPARSYASAIVQTLDFLAGAPAIPAAASGLRRVASLKQRLTRILAGGNAGRLGLGGRAAVCALGLGLLPLLPSLAQSTTTQMEMQTATTISVSNTDDNSEIPADSGDAIVDMPIDGSPSPRAFSYSPDGRQLALAMENQTVEIRDVASGHRVRILRGHSGPVNCLAYSPDGKTLATGSSDRTVRLWDARGGKLKAVLKGHDNWVYALAFSPDGKMLVSGGYDRTIRLWSIAGKAIAVLKGHESAVRALAFSRDGQTLASGGGDEKIRLWNVAARQVRATLTGHSDTVRALAFAANGQTLASAGDDGTVRLWDPRTGIERAAMFGHTAEVTSLTFSPFGQILVSAGMDRTIRWWDVGQVRQVALVPTNRDGVIGMAFAPEHDKLTILGQDRQVRQMLLSRVAVQVRPTEAKNQMYVLAEKPFAYRRTVSVARLEAKRAESTGTDVDEMPRILIVEIKRAQ